jgi:hypothetical protein
MGSNLDWIKLVNEFEAEYSMYALNYDGRALDLHTLIVSEMMVPSFTFILILRLHNTRS